MTNNSSSISKKIGKREWNKLMIPFVMGVNELQVGAKDGIRYDIWSDQKNQTVRLVENHIHEGKEVIIINDCHPDNFRGKLYFLLLEKQRGESVSK